MSECSIFKKNLEEIFPPQHMSFLMEEEERLDGEARIPEGGGKKQDELWVRKSPPEGWTEPQPRTMPGL